MVARASFFNLVAEYAKVIPFHHRSLLAYLSATTGHLGILIVGSSTTQHLSAFADDFTRMLRDLRDTPKFMAQVIRNGGRSPTKCVKDLIIWFPTSFIGLNGISGVASGTVFIG